MSATRRWLLVGGASLALVATALVGPTQAAASPTGAVGNNGTVKVHQGGVDDATNAGNGSDIDNDPHVCTFHLHFFFADAAQTGTWWVQSWPPTGGHATVLQGSYLTDAHGEYRTPAAPGAYTLADGHYKVFWEGRDSQNIKMKVFWVGCASGAGAGQGDVVASASLTATPGVGSTGTGTAGTGTTGTGTAGTGSTGAAAGGTGSTGTGTTGAAVGGTAGDSGTSPLGVGSTGAIASGTGAAATPPLTSSAGFVPASHQEPSPISAIVSLLAGLVAVAVFVTRRRSVLPRR